MTFYIPSGVPQSVPHFSEDYPIQFMSSLRDSGCHLPSGMVCWVEQLTPWVAESPIAPVDPPLAPGIPEPDVWAMLIMGFLLIGRAMRRRRKGPRHARA
jgi:hypothetical protein